MPFGVIRQCINTYQRVCLLKELVHASSLVVVYVFACSIAAGLTLVSKVGVALM